MRYWLQKAHGDWESSVRKHGVVDGCEGCCGAGDALVSWGKMPHARYNRYLRDSTFGLVLRGDQRWSHRFTEVLKAGAIPVVLSDGLRLPLEPLVDWARAAIVLPEEDAKDFKRLMRRLCELDAPRKAAMQRAGRTVYELCVATPEAQADCLLRALAMLVERRSEPGVAERAAEAAVASLHAPACPLTAFRTFDDWWPNGGPGWKPSDPGPSPPAVGVR